MRPLLHHLDSLAEYTYRRIHPILIILFIFTVKIAWGLYMVDAFSCLYKVYGIAVMIGDSPSYIEPMENYIVNGKYEYKGVTIGRIPYLGVLYYPFRILFSKKIALSIIVIFQLLMESVSIFFLARLAHLITGSIKSFILTILIFLFYITITSYSVTIMTESLSISFLILFLYFYYKFIILNRNKMYNVQSGIFLALATNLRPFLLPLYFLVLAEDLLYCIRNKRIYPLNRAFINKLLFLCPIIVISAPWTIRNYIISHHFIPFQEPYGGYATAGFPGYRPADLAIFNFIRTIGENAIWWDNGAGCYFSARNNSRCTYSLPDRIFKGQLTKERIEQLRNVYLKYLHDNAIHYEKFIIDEANELSEIYRKNNPLSFYLWDSFRLLSMFMVRNPVVNLPFGKYSPCFNVIHIIMKGGQLVIYYFMLVFGLVGLFLMLIKNKKTFAIFSVPFLIIAIFIYLRYVETRYFVIAHPCLILGTVFTAQKIFHIYTRQSLTKN